MFSSTILARNVVCLGFEEEEEDLDYIMLCYDTLVAIAWPAIAGAQFMYFKIIIL